MPPSSTYVNNLAAIGAKYGSTRNELERDVLKAMQFYAQAAQYGHPGANFELGCLYHFGIPGVVSVNHSKAMKHYKVASEAGMIGAKYNLGLLWEKHDEDKAMVLWGEAADLGHTKAMCCLAVRYFHGITIDEKTGKIAGVVPQDFNKAMYYWGLAAEQDCPKAIHSLSLMYEHGLGVKQHTKRADELRDLAAFCWTQQHQPKPGQLGERPVDLPEWLKKPDGNFPNWRQRNFVASRRAPPLLLKKYSTGQGPSAVKQLMGDTITAHSYKPSHTPESKPNSSSAVLHSASLSTPTSTLAMKTPKNTNYETNSKEKTVTVSKGTSQVQSQGMAVSRDSVNRSPDCRRSSTSRPSTPSKEIRSCEFLARIEQIKDEDDDIKQGSDGGGAMSKGNGKVVSRPQHQSLFALNFQDRYEMPHMNMKANKVVSQTRLPRARSASSPTKTRTAARAITAALSTTPAKTPSSPLRAASASSLKRSSHVSPPTAALMNSNQSSASSPSTPNQIITTTSNSPKSSEEGVNSPPNSVNKSTSSPLLNHKQLPFPSTSTEQISTRTNSKTLTSNLKEKELTSSQHAPAHSHRKSKTRSPSPKKGHTSALTSKNTNSRKIHFNKSKRKSSVKSESDSLPKV